MEITQSPRVFTVVLSEEEARYICKVVGCRTDAIDTAVGLDSAVGSEIHYTLAEALDDE